jgi:hypothetical protein
MALSAEQVAQICYQAGFRGADLVAMVAIAKRESSYNPSAHRTDQDPSALSGDMGLFQINYVNWNTVSSALGLTDKRQLFDPLINAKAAKVLFDRSGLAPWTAGAGGWTAGGDPFYGTNRSAAEAAVKNAAAQGLLGQDWSGGGGGGVGSTIAPGSTPGTGTPEQRTTELPSDAQIYVIDGTFEVFAVFDVGNGVKLAYTVDLAPGATNWLDKPRNVVGRDQWDGMGVTVAGSTGELQTTQVTFGNFKAFWDSIVGQVMGYNNPAAQDPDVMRVIAEFAARPDMDPAELQNRLQATQWYQRHTQGQLQWNSLSEAERQMRRDQVAAQMAQTWMQFVGEPIGTQDPRIRNHLEEVASGAMGMGAWTENYVKRHATDNPESPWSRSIRDEQETQRKRGIDVENTAMRVKDTARRWGIRVTDSWAMDWARQIVEKTKSDEDLMMSIKQQAQTLYPTKDPEMETLEWAQPWLATYERTLEETASLDTPEVQSALSGGQQVWELEQLLRKSKKWLGTKNGQQAITSTMADVGRTMGFF